MNDVVIGKARSLDAAESVCMVMVVVPADAAVAAMSEICS